MMFQNRPNSLVSQVIVCCVRIFAHAHLYQIKHNIHQDFIIKMFVLHGISGKQFILCLTGSLVPLKAVKDFQFEFCQMITTSESPKWNGFYYLYLVHLLRWFHHNRIRLFSFVLTAFFLLVFERIVIDFFVRFFGDAYINVNWVGKDCGRQQKSINE